jgi:hypothetical protein
MASVMTYPQIFFPPGYDARQEFETPARGYLSHVQVQLENGNRYQLFFYDPVRLQQDLEEQVKSGRICLAEPNMIVLPEVTTENIKRALQELWERGCFEELKAM